MSGMRLLLIVNRVPAGGAEAQLVHLARGLAERGERVTLCCVDSCTLEDGELDGAGIELVELGVHTRYGRFASIPRLALMARRADVVHCTMWDPSLWGRIAAILARRPSIVADHATDRSLQMAATGKSRAGWIAVHNRVLDRFTFATVACAAEQRPMLLSEGVAPEKVVYIPNGIPIARELAAAAATRTRAELGLPASGPLLVHVGRFNPEKNQRGALDAVRTVRADVPDAQLVLVGDGPMRPEVEAHADEIGAGGWAHFLGFRTDTPALLAHADLMLLPSIADAMPMVILEAMALGVPTVATDLGDIREVLGEAGVAIEPGDTDAFAAATAGLLADPEERARMTAAARARAPEFDASRMVARYLALFEAAVAKRPPIEAVAAAG
jgi:glycosyltransferase involved in cell wall biosynthesis